MCGISGIISKSSSFDLHIQQMIDAQTHRGPDFQTIYADINKGVYFGHNRLSIIDLHAHSNQPFHSPDKQYAMVFNGEIYNYLELKKQLEPHYNFSTHSDTEVLLAAYIVWGEKCLDKLTGMFAFAVWDHHSETLFAARDRFGVKPFHYYIDHDKFIFASEIKALWASGLVDKKMDSATWASYMGYAVYSTIDRTFWQDVHQLAGGHYLKVQAGKFEIKKWYTFFDNVSNIVLPGSFDEAKEHARALLINSIKLRLRSDVNVGFNLSGGIDSSLLFTLIRDQLNANSTKAFTFYSDDENYDEVEWVKQIIGNSGFNWEKCLVTADSIPQYAKFMQHHQDEPYAGIAALAYGKVFQHAKAANYTVLLDGGGMDEQVAGYDYYTNDSSSLIQGTTSSPVRKHCLVPEFLQLGSRPKFDKPFNDKVKDLQYRDTFYTKLPRDLRFNDRMSMASSTELREPFLDHNLFEYLFALPLEYKIQEQKKKFIIREILKEKLTGSVTEAPKRPIQTPQREWLSHELKDWVVSMAKTACAKHDFLIKKEVDKELELYFSGNNENSFYIWQWITLGLI